MIFVEIIPIYFPITQQDCSKFEPKAALSSRKGQQSPQSNACDIFLKLMKF